jgi:putative transposase
MLSMSDQFTLRGVPGHIRFEHSPEFVAKAEQQWITATGAKTAYIEAGSPLQNTGGCGCPG